MTTIEENTIALLERLTGVIRNSDKVEKAKFDLVNETKEVPTEYWMTRKPSGWTNVDIHIRFYRDVN